MISFPGGWLGGDSLTVELARGDLEHKTSEHYKRFVVRCRLKRVLNEAVKSNASVREEEVRRFPGRYIDSVKSPDGRVQRSNREKRDAFRAYFRDRFARCPDLPLQEFLSESFTVCHHRSDWPRADLRCKGKIDPGQFALDSRGPRGDRRRHGSRADQFRSVQGLR